ncbi:aspartic peptidase A1 [Tricholoma matsutake]|nr:aspartic peptidase A1 [Tricholoma matsutake 945]
MFTTSLLTVLLLCSVVSTNAVVIHDSPVRLPLTRRLNVTSLGNLVLHDQARAKALRARAGASAGVSFSTAIVGNEPVDNQAVTYVAAIGVGTPPTTYQLIVDTGSSNTWVGASQAYARTSSSVATNQAVSVTYGSGSFSGNEFLDTVTITSQLVIHSQSIGVATTSTGFSGVDGIIGIGPVDLTYGTLTNQPNTAIPTVTDNLFSQNIISANEIGISFEPTTQPQVLNGELTWGGTDSSKYTGAISYTPVTSTYPASYYWGIQQTITYGTSTSILTTTAGIVDTGTTLVLIASDAYNRYVTATGAVLDNATGLLRITSAQYANLQSLFFHINGVTYELTANAQLWPRSLNTLIGGTSGSIYLIVANLGTPTGQGLDFINGYAFLERFYSVFDTAGHRVGLATTPYTYATTN